MKCVPSLVRCLLTPDPVDQLEARNALAGPEREHAERRKPLRAGNLDSPPAEVSAHTPEQPHAERICRHFPPRGL
jgi:hypothetical protein